MKKLLILGGSGLLGSTLTTGYYLKKYNINSHSLRSKTNLKADLEDKENDYLQKILNIQKLK